MEYSNLFLLSFVSKNLKNFIKSSQITRFKSINSIVYDDNGGNPPWVYIPHRCYREMILNFSNYYSHDRNCYQLNLSGTMIDFGTPMFNCPLAYGRPSEPVIELIHNYLLDLFGSSVEYRVRTCSDIESFLPRSTWLIPPLQNLSALKIFCNGDKADMRKIWNDFSLYPVFKHIKFYFMCLSVEDQDGYIIDRNAFPSQSGKLFPRKCKLYQAESIETTQFYISTPTILSHFQGRQAILKCVIFSSLYLIEFIRRWKSGEAFQKLEYLKIEKVYGDESDFPQILDRIGAKYIDETKTPPRHTLPKIFIEYHDSQRNTPEIISHTYVVRESDNRAASVLIQGRVFQFGVWDKTEEEFLRMVE
ncbi:unnamed protein product [Caenorhabditis nigoni]